MRVDAIGGTPDNPEFISVVNSSDEEQEIALTGNGDYTGVFTGRELSLQTNTNLRIEAKDAELYVNRR